MNVLLDFLVADIIGGDLVINGRDRRRGLTSTLCLALLLPFGSGETEGLGVFGDGSFGLVLDTIGEDGFDLDAHFDFCVGIGSEGRNDFFGDLHDAHLPLP